MTATIPAALVDARAAVDADLRAAIGRLDPDTRRVSEYHVGWINADGEPDARSGKALRPALVLLAAQGSGGTAAQATPGAVAVELVHNFSLLHDDLMDGDLSRRHRPTAWTVFGRSAALLAGDALLALATDTLLQQASPHVTDAARVLSTAVSQLISGQAADLDFEQRMDVSLAECHAMVAGKTAALLGCSTSIGAVLAGAPTWRVQRLRSFGVELGMAFQLVDDLLGLWGDPDTTGKPVLSDLRTRKKSMPVVHALTSGTDAGNRLRDLYGQPGDMTDEQLREAAEMVERAGSREWAHAECERRLGAARHQLELADCGPAAEGLNELADFILRRQQ